MLLPLNNQTFVKRRFEQGPRAIRWGTRTLLALMIWLPSSASASIFKGEALDKAADVLTWIVLVIAPIVGIGVFLLIHILPEKIAEKKQHPQAKAIQCLCLLSLVFGGMLWPIAWLWAYSKPVLYKLAYGTDKGAHGHEETPPAAPTPTHANAEEEELQELKNRITELEIRLHNNNHNHVGKG